MKMTSITKFACMALFSLATATSAHEKISSPKNAAAIPVLDKSSRDTKSSTQSSAQSSTQTAVIAVVEKFHLAINTADSALAKVVLAPNVMIFEQGHRESSRDEYLGHHFKEDAAFAKAVPSVTKSQAVRAMGEMAFVMTESITDGVYKDKPVKGASVATYILARQDEQWRIVHIHWSSRKRS